MYIKDECGVMAGERKTVDSITMMKFEGPKDLIRNHQNVAPSVGMEFHVAVKGRVFVAKIGELTRNPYSRETEVKIAVPAYATLVVGVSERVFSSRHRWEDVWQLLRDRTAAAIDNVLNCTATTNWQVPATPKSDYFDSDRDIADAVAYGMLAAGLVNKPMPVDKPGDTIRFRPDLAKLKSSEPMFEDQPLPPERPGVTVRGHANPKPSKRLLLT